MPEVPDELLDMMLADKDMVEQLEAPLKAMGMTQSLAAMPREMQRAAVAAMMAVMQKSGADDEEADTTPDIPDAAVRAVFAEPKRQALLRDVMQQNGLEGDPADLPFSVQRKIVEALVQADALSLADLQPASPPPPTPVATPVPAGPPASPTTSSATLSALVPAPAKPGFFRRMFGWGNGTKH
jgi:hypothetical protein